MIFVLYHVDFLTY